MQVKNNREEFVEVKRIEVKIDEETKFRRTVTEENRMIVTKVNDDDNRINLHPVVSNQVEIF
jgi:hypothetical protein